MSKDDKKDENKNAQSKRAMHGNAFEKTVFVSIDTKKLAGNNKSILLGSELNKRRPDVYSKMVLAPTIGKGFVGDVDILLFCESTRIPELIISTKTTIRERLYQVITTKHMYQELYPNLSVWFVTEDTNLEFGSVKKPRHARKLAEYFHVPCYSTNADTEVWGYVKHFSSLQDDIERIYCNRKIR